MLSAIMAIDVDVILLHNLALIAADKTTWHYLVRCN